MVLKIIWSEFAETQLDEIYEYYEKKASPRIAKKLLKGIINEPKKLIKTPILCEKCGEPHILPVNMVGIRK